MISEDFCLFLNISKYEFRMIFAWVEFPNGIIDYVSQGQSIVALLCGVVPRNWFAFAQGKKKLKVSFVCRTNSAMGQK